MRTSLVALAALAALGGAGLALASSPRTYPGDDFTLRVDASGAIHREVLIVQRVDSSGLAGAPDGAEAPAEAMHPIESETETDLRAPVAPAVVPPIGDDCVIPDAAISATDEHAPFPNRDGRFSKVPKYLVPFYEAACDTFDVPVRYLLAQGSYETHFTSKHGDGGNSCGVHQFFDRTHTWRSWFGAGGLADCMNPEKNIRRAAQHLRELMDGKVYPALGKRTIAQALYHYNGSGAKARSYSARIQWGADTYYR